MKGWEGGWWEGGREWGGKKEKSRHRTGYQQADVGRQGEDQCRHTAQWGLPWGWWGGVTGKRGGGGGTREEYQRAVQEVGPRALSGERLRNRHAEQAVYLTDQEPQKNESLHAWPPTCCPGGHISSTWVEAAKNSFINSSWYCSCVMILGGGGGQEGRRGGRGGWYREEGGGVTLGAYGGGRGGGGEPGKHQRSAANTCAAHRGQRGAPFPLSPHSQT